MFSRVFRVRFFRLSAASRGQYTVHYELQLLPADKRVCFVGHLCRPPENAPSAGSYLLIRCDAAVASIGDQFTVSLFSEEKQVAAGRISVQTGADCPPNRVDPGRIQRFGYKMYIEFQVLTITGQILPLSISTQCEIRCPLNQIIQNSDCAEFPDPVFQLTDVDVIFPAPVFLLQIAAQICAHDIFPVHTIYTHLLSHIPYLHNRSI